MFINAKYLSAGIQSRIDGTGLKVATSPLIGHNQLALTRQKEPLPLLGIPTTREINRNRG